MKRVAVAISVLLILALAGTAVARFTGGDGSTTPVADSVSVAATSPAQPVAAPSPAAAAVAAVAMTGEVVTAGLISRRELIESFTTPSFGGELADLTSEQVTSLQLAMAEAGRAVAHLSVAEFPLRARTVSLEPDRATVDVWSVLVVSAADEAVARQVWRTVTVDLELVDGRWLVDGWRSVNGPSPAMTPEGDVAPAAEVSAALGWAEVN